MITFSCSRRSGWRLNSSHEQQHDKDNQNDADDADAAVTIAISVAAKAATKPAEQEDNEDDDEDDAERHGAVLLRIPKKSAGRELSGTHAFSRYSELSGRCALSSEAEDCFLHIGYR